MMLHCRTAVAVRVAALAVSAVLLAGCGPSEGYPSLAGVPERPRSPFSSADRVALQTSLEADRARAAQREAEPFAASSVTALPELGRGATKRPAATGRARPPAATIRAPRRNDSGGLFDFLAGMAEDDPTGPIDSGDVDRAVDALPGPLAP